MDTRDATRHQRTDDGHAPRRATTGRRPARRGAARRRLGVPVRALRGRDDPGDLPAGRCRRGNVAARHRLRVGPRRPLRRRDGCRRRRASTRPHRWSTSPATARPTPTCASARCSNCRGPTRPSTPSRRSTGSGVGARRALVEAHRVLRPGGAHRDQLLGEGPPRPPRLLHGVRQERSRVALRRHAAHERHLAAGRRRGDARVGGVRGDRARRSDVDPRMARRRHRLAGRVEHRSRGSRAGARRARRPASRR